MSTGKFASTWTGSARSGSPVCTQTLEQSSLGALLCFDFANIRYATATHIGTWAIDKLIRFALIPRGGDPIIWDFGSAARHHQLYNPWLDPSNNRGHAHAGSPDQSCHTTHGSRPGLSTLRGAIPPAAGLADDVAAKVYDVLAEHGLHERAARRRRHRDARPRRPHGARAHRRRRPAGVPRGAPDQDRRTRSSLLTHACSMVDAAYEELYRALRPGVRENECVGLVAKTLLDLGLGVRRGRQRDLRRALLAAPARLLRPDHPPRRPGVLRHPAQLQRLPHVLLPHVPGRQRVAGAARRLQDLPRVHRPGDRARQARRDDRRHLRRLAGGHRVRLRRRDGRLRPAVRPRRRPVDLGTADLQPDDLVRPPRGARGGHGLRPGDVLARRRRLVGVADRGGGRRHRRRVRGDHPLPGRGAARLRHALLDDRLAVADAARIAVAPQHQPAGSRSRHP